jgi:methyl-accepting chemotaxis protein
MHQHREGTRAGTLMAARLSRLSIGTKMGIAVFAAVLATTSALTWFVVAFTTQAMDRKSLEELQQHSASAVRLLQTADLDLREAIDMLGRTLMASYPSTFTLDPERTVEIAGVNTPALRAGGHTLNGELGDIDRFTSITGAVATVFVRSGNDFVRIATSLKNDRAQRVLGTSLAKDHPGRAALLANQSFTGKAQLFGRTYMTQYLPVHSREGAVVGALFVGLDFSERLAKIKTAMRQIKIGDTGYVFALDANPGANYGVLTLHPTQEGQNIAAAKDSAGHEFVREILEKKTGVIEYPWVDAQTGQTAAREKIVAFDYFPAWGWVIGSGSYKSEFIKDARALKLWMHVGALATLLFIGAVVSVLSRRIVARPLSGVIGLFDQIGRGNYANHIEVRSADEVGNLLTALRGMQEKLGADIERAQVAAAATLRVKNALDNCSTNVMIADNDGRIIYLNNAVTEMLKRAESDLRKALPHFDASKLMGASFDSFHKNPAHQRSLLAGLKGTYQTQLNIGRRTLALTVNPIVNDRGERLGSVVEWLDRTAEVAVEAEVADIVKAAAAGDFTKRLELAGKEGFFRQLSEGMNRLLETAQIGLQEVARVLSALAEGNLTEKITNDYQGTFAQLKSDSNRTVEQLTGIVTQIKRAAEAINTAAKEIATGNSDLSSRTEQQASSLEETASSMEELTATVKQNAENAKQANQLAINASAVASRGGEVVGQVVHTMDAINASAKKIVDIISVIDGIAFQTNILALNAAVEAARAGEQGRGFAVVATEVRNLAQRSAAAAKEIKSLISDSSDKVQTGSRLVDQAGATMQDVVSAIKRVTDIMGEISAAAVEQSAGIEQVNQAITQMDEVTQQNAALVEQAAAAAESLEDQAGGLTQAVSVFKMAKEGPRLVAAGTARRLASVAAAPAAKPARPALKATGTTGMTGDHE